MRPRPDAMRPISRPRPERVRPRLRPNDLASRPHGPRGLNIPAEGPRDAKSCRGTRVETSSSMRPIATDAQLWGGQSIHAAYCYAIVAMVEQPGGQCTGSALLFLYLFTGRLD